MATIRTGSKKSEAKTQAGIIWTANYKYKQRQQDYTKRNALVCVCVRARALFSVLKYLGSCLFACCDRAPKTHGWLYGVCVCVCTLYGCEPFTPTAIKGPHRITMHHNAIYHKHQSQWKNAVSYSKQKAYESDGLPTFCSFNEKLSRSTFPLTLVRSLVLLTKDAN